MGGNEITATVGTHNGGMSLFIDGEAQPFTFFKITETVSTEEFLESATIEIPAMARNGVNLCWVPVFLDWKGPGEYDFTDFDKRITTVLELYDAHTPVSTPPARIVVRLQAAVFHPQWHIDTHRDAKGKPTNLIQFRNPWGKIEGCGCTEAISPGDDFWDTHAVNCLRAIVAHVRQSGYAHRVFGWLPCAFNSNEWFIRTFAPEATCDFSAPTQKAFRARLAKLGIECGDAPVPSPEACQRSGRGEFLDTVSGDGRLVEEFSLWLNNRIADIILNFAGIIKRLYADSPKLVGFFYGYTNELSFFQNVSQSGHLALRRILASDRVDFICSPCQYRYRRDEGAFTYNLVLGPFAHSGACHGKLVFAEDDHFPVFARTTNTDFSTRDEWHDEMFFRRNFAQVLSSGQQMWWYSLAPCWFKEEYRQEIAAQLHRVGKEALVKDRAPVAEVAVVVDERSIQAMRLNAPFQSRLILESLAGCFPTGTPVECHELISFLDHTDHARFKVVVFLNLFLVDTEILAKVDHLKSNGRTLLFSFAPGVLSGEQGMRRFSLETASQLAGMELIEEKREMPLSVWMDPDRVPMAAGEDIRYGWLNPEVPVKPVIGIADAAAVPLGFLHLGVPGFGMRKHSYWTSIFSAAPGIPPPVMRTLFKNAGVHIYSDSEDVIYANHSMIAISASSRGEKTLSLPHTATLVDALTGEQLQPVDGAFRMFLKRHETRIFWTL